MSMMNVAILGGGISGLASAYRLARAGASVTLYEASDSLGGLGAWFEHDGHNLDRYYHVLLDSDTHLLGMLEELGISDCLGWSQTTMGFFVRGKPYPFNTALDLLRFKPLSFIDRVRTGMAALYITKFKKNGIPLDDEPAHEWLIRLFGRRVYANIWEPLLNAKFGDLRDRVPAYWIWNTLNREKNGSQEVKAYPRGGYAVIANRLVDAIEAAGGDIHLNTKVSAVEDLGDRVRLMLPSGPKEFDALVSTVPLPLLRKLSSGSLASRVPLPDLAYQGVVNVLLLQKERLERHYWTAVVDSDFPFQGVVETTHVIRPEWIGDRHLLYVMNYCSSDSAQYNTKDDMLIDQAIKGLGRLYPKFDRTGIETAYVFRAPHVEPVWTRGYLRQRPKSRIDGSRIYLATTAQAYPMVTSWNTSVKLAEDAVKAIMTDVPPRLVGSGSPITTKSPVILS